MLSNAIGQSAAIAERVLKVGAGVIATEMRRQLKGILSEEATGRLVESLGITPVRHNAEGVFNAHIGFDGYDSVTGVPHQLKARVLESGAKYADGTVRKARPFARPAVLASKARANEAMKAEFEKIIKEIKGNG